MKRRAWNSTLPAPTKPLPRSTTPIRKRGKSRFPKRRDEAFRDWIRELPCCLADCFTRWKNVECAHVKSRGAGGDDIENCVPLCRGHHDYQHDIGIKSFQLAMHIDLAATAQALAARWRAETGKP